MFTMMALILGISAFFYLFDCSENMAIKKEKTGTSDFQANSNVYHLSLCIIFILGLVFAQQRVGYSLFLTQYYGDSGASFIFMLNALLIIFFLPTVTSFAIKKNQILTMGSGALLLGGGMFFLCLASSSWWLTVLICLVTTLGEMLGTTLSQLLCFQYAPDAYKGKAMSYYKFLYALGTIFGTLTGGKLQMLWGENYVWFFCGIVGVLSMVLCFIAQHKEVQTRAPGNWRQQIS